MPMIESIDAIARRLQRDALMLVFCNGRAVVSLRTEPMDLRWQQDPARIRILAWLDGEGIGWSRCLPFLLDGFREVRYQGHVFIDLPNQREDLRYRRLLAQTEARRDDGSHDGVGLFVMRLSTAMQNLRPA